MAFWPGAAEAVPTVKRDWANEERQSAGVRRAAAKIACRERIDYLREGCEDSAVETVEAMLKMKGFNAEGAEKRGRAGVRPCTRRSGSRKVRLARQREFSPARIIFLHGGAALVFCECELASISSATAKQSTAAARASFAQEDES